LPQKPAETGGMGHWLAALLASTLFSSAPAHEAALAESSLVRAQGWTRVGFPLGGAAPAVGIAIDGRVRLGRVEILFGDGTLDRHELAPGHVYGRGVYELSRFTDARRVMLVRLEARACTARAKLSAVLLHDAPQGPAPVD
jgi:hypothetical protein